MLKSDLRKIYKQKRELLSTNHKELLQNKIYQQIFQLDINAINNVHVFLSMNKFKEIDTQPIIEFFREKNKKIIVSKCNFSTNSLSHFFLKKNTKLTLNKFGVPEPVNAEEVSVTKIDLVFVPLLISDEKKYRVGYGKGFYDRFLSDCRKDSQKIGLNFFNPIKQISDVHEFDIPLDFVITPK